MAKQIKFLMWDYGGYVDFARRLAENGKNHVYYYIPNPGEDKFKNWAPGIGFEDEGVEKIQYITKELIDEVDYILFFDKGAGDIAAYLRETSFKPVFGAGLGEKLENDRMAFTKVQEALGIDTPERTWIKGIDKLKEFLQDKEDKYVKINVFRDDFETTHFTNMDSFELIADKFEVDFGPSSQNFDFLVEEPIKGFEPGFDCLFNNKGYSNYFMWGFALESWVNIGKFVKEMPKPLQEVADKLAPALRRADYRGFLGAEVRISEDLKRNVLTDITCRMSAPVSMAYPEAFKNFTEVICQTADGEKIEIEPRDEYFIMVPLASDKSMENWVQLEFDQKYQRLVKSQSDLKVDGKIYFAKGNRRSGYSLNLIATGSSLERCIEIVKRLSKEVNAWGLDKMILDTLDTIPEFVKQCPKYGLGKF